MAQTPLTLEHKRFIVKKLACGADPSDVAAQVNENFLIDLRAADVARFNPDLQAGKALPEGLTRLYRRTRDAYLAGQGTSTTFVRVAETSAFEDQEALCVEKKGHRLAVFKTDDQFYALDNTCTHQGGPLCEGILDDGEIECPWHGARFDVASGEATASPAVDSVTSYPLRIREQHIEVEL